MDNNLTLGEALAGLVIFFAIVIGVRILWAVVVYKDWKCGVADCRIIK